MTFDFDLFIGFSVDSMYEERLAATPLCRLEMFLDNGGDNLHDVEYNGMRFIGKKLGSHCSVADIDDIGNNITTTFAALVGEDTSHLSLELFAIPVVL